MQKLGSQNTSLFDIDNFDKMSMISFRSSLTTRSKSAQSEKPARNYC